ncbi:calponin homology domain-containing protein [Protomyces lactucae-debilis]|uniref:Calponin homology domain-containing protein n=1 Tax=Protomyces lactucae-debilis TaxID=2754530 RepID=A0A1Y2ES87_PROLT|nr:calponin homology domain-containing protein [Protomyces lactucae-debilis]ORY74377.1 calponin homology domain-containing protein [Protomyces lactucae-debilis]
MRGRVAVFRESISNVRAVVLVGLSSRLSVWCCDMKATTRFHTSRLARQTTTRSAMSESRGELLQWLNQLTGLGLTKVEQCGKGYACAQIFDSIYGDMPLKKIDFNANAEFKYLANWKVIQTHFNKHKIDKVIPVERLAKCKMQDNLEFLQWSKKYWDQMFPGGDYNAMARRGGQSSGSNLSNSTSSHHAAPSAARVVSSTAPKRAPGAAGRPAVGAVARAPPVNSAQLVQLQEEVEVLHETVAGLEKERDFYFNKLRDIEILIQGAGEADSAAEEGGLLKRIQEVLYSTEDGFEVPDNEGEDGLQGTEQGLQALDVNDEVHENDDEVF